MSVCTKCVKPFCPVQSVREYECEKKYRMEPRTATPPTVAQVERIRELKDLPEFAPHLDWLAELITQGRMDTREQAEWLIATMRNIVRIERGELMHAKEPESLSEQALEGSATGPCKTHGDIWHPKCRTHDCCVGHHASSCRAAGKPLLDLFEEYERSIPGEPGTQD